MARLHRPKAGFVVRTWVVLLWHVDTVLFRMRWRNMQRIPPPEQGGVVIAINHLSHIDTILNLALEGRLPDPTNGALYFRSATAVAGQTPVAVVKDHAFFARSGQALQQASDTGAQEIIDPAPSAGSSADMPARIPAVPRLGDQ